MSLRHIWAQRCLFINRHIKRFVLYLLLQSRRLRFFFWNLNCLSRDMGAYDGRSFSRLSALRVTKISFPPFVGQIVREHGKRLACLAGARLNNLTRRFVGMTYDMDTWLNLGLNQWPGRVTHNIQRATLSKVELSALAVPVGVCLLYFPCWATPISKSQAPFRELCSFSSYDEILCSVNAPLFGFPFGSLTNPGNHHFPSNKLQVLQSAHGFNAAADRPSIHFPTQPIWTLTHDLPSLSRNTLIRQSMERKVGGDHSWAGLTLGMITTIDKKSLRWPV